MAAKINLCVCETYQRDDVQVCVVRRELCCSIKREGCLPFSEGSEEGLGGGWRDGACEVFMSRGYKASMTKLLGLGSIFFSLLSGRALQVMLLPRWPSVPLHL